MHRPCLLQSRPPAGQQFAKGFPYRPAQGLSSSAIQDVPKRPPDDPREHGDRKAQWPRHGSMQNLPTGILAEELRQKVGNGTPLLTAERPTDPHRGGSSFRWNHLGTHKKPPRDGLALQTQDRFVQFHTLSSHNHRLAEAGSIIKPESILRETGGGSCASYRLKSRIFAASSQCHRGTPQQV